MKDKLTTSHRFWIILISVFKWIKESFYNFICFITNHEFHVITFWIHYMLFIIIIFREIKLIVIVNWIFHVPEFLRSFMMSFKYDLIFSRYSATNSVLFLSLLLLYSRLFKIIYSYYFIIIFFLFFILKKILNISKYYISNSFKNSFFSLKRFFISLIVSSSSDLVFSIIIYYEKKQFFQKIKVCYTS